MKSRCAGPVRPLCITDDSTSHPVRCATPGKQTPLEEPVWCPGILGK